MRRIIGSAVVLLLIASPLWAGSGQPTLSFEEIVDRTDRVVWGTVAEAVGERLTAKQPQGGPDKELVLGHLDQASGMVFTTWRVRVEACLFDRHETPCASADVEIWIPGGLVREMHDGEQRLVETILHDEPASAPPNIGTEYVLFLRETGRGASYYIVPDRNARLAVSRTTGEPRVTLRFNDRTLLSSDAVRLAENERVAGAQARTPGMTSGSPPRRSRSSEFTDQSDKYQEAVPLFRVTDLVKHLKERQLRSRGSPE